MRAQVLDALDLERERGITIKAQAVALDHRDADGRLFRLNFIDTPGHADFSYEVSRSLAACEGALLVVDAAQGVQAQTIANCVAALAQDLTIVPVLNKIDLPAAEPEKAKEEIIDLLGVDASDAVLISAKTGVGIDELLARLTRDIPPPPDDFDSPLRALIIDSWFDNYAGVVALTRVFSGRLARGTRLSFMAGGDARECESVGVFTPKPKVKDALVAGEVGFVVTGLKDISAARVGDTITDARRPANTPLAGFARSKARVFASFYPQSAADFPSLRDAAAKLQLNDAAFVFEPETSPALGFGLRCGFLGLLHLEITQERIEREYGVDLVATAPGVAYEIETIGGEILRVDNPGKMPSPDRIRRVIEPVALATVLCPAEHIGRAIEIANEARGIQKRLDTAGRQMVLVFEIPFAELAAGFYDRLKSATRGFGSLDYEMRGGREADIVKLEILVNGKPVDALATMTPRAAAEKRGREIAGKIRELVPRQMVDIAVQAAVGGRIVARETVKAMRKNVLAKCYGGDVTRKRKLLEKQKAGKKRMKRFADADIPQEAFLAALRRD